MTIITIELIEQGACVQLILSTNIRNSTAKEIQVSSHVTEMVDAFMDEVNKINKAKAEL